MTLRDKQYTRVWLVAVAKYNFYLVSMQCPRRRDN